MYICRKIKVQHMHLINWQTRSYQALEIVCASTTYKYLFKYIFIKILTIDIISMTKELLLAFSNQALLQDYIWKCEWRYLGLTSKQCALTVFISFCCIYSSVFVSSKVPSYLSHAINSYLHGKLINWTSAFYLSFCCTVLPRILII